MDPDIESFNLSDDEAFNEAIEIVNSSISSIEDISIIDNDRPSENHLKILRKNFGHTSFRAMQWEIIRTILYEKRDQCVVMATGSGKSLCFQYPSVFTNGCTLVISPLISLMEDQVLSLKVAGISACFLGTAQKNSASVINSILENKYRLVYITPEYCTGDAGHQLLERMLKKLNITLIAVDEAHCISKWGHDFRSSYRSLNKLRNILPNIPILAVTATATDKVQEDICTALKMKNPKIRCTGFDRPNLYFEVKQKTERNILENLRPYLNEFKDESVIIYTLTKKDSEMIRDLLVLNDYSCETYHAGMPLNKRKIVHEKFTKDEIKIVVATVAFGMGIDKPDVRLVIHYGASKDLESYYQEVGRAGRDGLPAKCVTFFSGADFVIHDLLRQASSINKHLEEIGKFMKNYLYSASCRRKLILSYFTGKNVDEIQLAPMEVCCDNCCRKKNQPALLDTYKDLDEKGLFDFTLDSQMLLETIQMLEGKYGLGMYIKFLRGSKIEKITESLRKKKLYGAGAKKSEEWWKIIGRLLEEKKFLKKTKFKTFHTISLSSKGEKYLNNLRNSNDLDVMKLTPPSDVIPFLQKKIIRLTFDDEDDNEPIRFKNDSKTANTSSATTGTKTEIIETRPPAPAPTTTTAIKILRLFNDNDPDEIKEFNSKLFTNLKNYRNQIAHDYDCMPYMVATDTALMEMVQILPITLEMFTDAKFNNFNENKIMKFGPKFVNFLQDYLDKNNCTVRIPTIEVLLKEYPYKKAVLNPSALTTLALLKENLTISQIAQKRNLAHSTVHSHLSVALGSGAPITLKELSISEDTIVAVLKDIVKHSFKNISEIKLSILKETLPDVDWDTLRFIYTYIDIREYIESLKQPYKDHDPTYFKIYKNLKYGECAKNDENPNENHHTSHKENESSVHPSEEIPSKKFYSAGHSSTTEKENQNTEKLDDIELSEQDLAIIQALESLADDSSSSSNEEKNFQFNNVNETVQESPGKRKSDDDSLLTFVKKSRN